MDENDTGFQDLHRFLIRAGSFLEKHSLEEIGDSSSEVESFSAQLKSLVEECDRLQMRQQHLTQVLRALREVNQLITHEKDRDSLLARTCKLLTRARGYTSAWVGLTDSSGSVRIMGGSGAGPGFEALQGQIDGGVLPQCFRQAHAQADVVVVDDPTTNCGDCAMVHEYRDASTLAGALRHGDREYGVLVLSLPESLAGDPEEKDLFKEIAESIAFALHALEIEEDHRRVEDDLHFQKDILEETGRIAKVGGWSFDPVTGEGFWTDEVARIHDIDLSVSPTRDFGIEFYAPESRSKIETAIKDVVEKGLPYDLELELLTAKGEVKWVRTIGRPVMEDGRVVRVQGSFQDITNRVQADAKVRESEKRFRSLVEFSPVPMRLAGSDGKVTLINSSFRQLFGYRLEDISTLGDWWRLAFPDEGYRSLAQEKWSNALKDAENAASVVEPSEYEVTCKDGSVVTVQISGITIGDSVLATFVDLTERKRAESILRSSEEQFRTVVENAPDAIFIQTGGCFAYLNPMAVRLFGVSNEPQLLGCPVVERFHPDFREIVADRIRRLNVDRQPVSTPEERVVQRHGKEIMAEFSAVPFTYRGEKGALVFARDITARKRTEESLRLQALVLNQIKDHVIVTDLEGRITYANEAERRILGYSTEELIGQSVTRLGEDPAKGASQSEIIERTLAEGEWRGEVVNYSANGSELILDCRASLVLDDFGHPIALCGISTDITDLKRDEKEMQSITAKLEAALASMTDAVFISDIEGTFIQFNEAFATFHRFKSKEECAKTLAEYPLFLDVFLSNGDLVPVEKWAVPRALRGESASNEEYTLRRRDTGETWVGSYNFAPIFDQAGSIVGSVVVARDITERKRAETALRESEDRFRTLVDAAPDGIFIQCDGRIEFLNPAMVEILGARSREEVLGADIFELTAPEYHESVRERIRIQREAAIAVPPLEEELIRVDGSRVFVEATAVPFPLKDRIAHLVFMRDITARRKDLAERENLQSQLQQSQKIESVGRLAGGVAHDFNNMLSLILGYGDILLEKLHPQDPLTEDVNEIISAGKRSVALTRQLLAFSRKQTLQPEVLNLNKVVKGLEKMLRRLIGEDIVLVLSLSKDLDSVMADSGQIEQVIMNLAVNARDAMPRGGKLIIETKNVFLDEAYVTTHSEIVPGKHVMLAVSDTGCGMDKETLASIFEPFYTTKEQGKGTGLGLSTVYGIVKQSGGTIWVYSSPGRGTSFKIYLQQVQSDSKDAEAAPPIADHKGSGQHILVVEDEASLRGLVSRMLSSLGYRVTLAANGGEALLLVEEKGLSPDLLMTDVVMPGMDGFVVAKRLTQMLPNLRVLYMSGYTDDAIAQHGDLDPDRLLLQKPYSISDLAAKLQEAFLRTAG